MDEKTIVELSRAVQKGSKLGIELIEKSSDLTKWIGKLVGLKDGEILGLMSDKLQFFRWERRCRMADKYNEKIGNQLMQPIPPKFLIPILENGSLEEDNDLQDLWINLLGSFTNREYKEEKRIAYVDIIKSLNPLDAKILSEIYFYDSLNKRDDMNFTSIQRDKIYNCINDDCFYLSLDNLYRVGYVKNSVTHEGIAGKAFSLSYLGKKFVEACIR